MAMKKMKMLACELGILGLLIFSSDAFSSGNTPPTVSIYSLGVIQSDFGGLHVYPDIAGHQRSDRLWVVLEYDRYADDQRQQTKPGFHFRAPYV